MTDYDKRKDLDLVDDDGDAGPPDREYFATGELQGLQMDPGTRSLARKGLDDAQEASAARIRKMRTCGYHRGDWTDAPKKLVPWCLKCCPEGT